MARSERWKANIWKHAYDEEHALYSTAVLIIEAFKQKTRALEENLQVAQKFRRDIDPLGATK